jgi:hypothetical protein
LFSKDEETIARINDIQFCINTTKKAGLNLPFAFSEGTTDGAQRNNQ